MPVVCAPACSLSRTSVDSTVAVSQRDTTPNSPYALHAFCSYGAIG
jgi:hypothetical protein